VDLICVHALYKHVLNMRQVAPLLPLGVVVYETGPRM